MESGETDRLGMMATTHQDSGDFADGGILKVRYRYPTNLCASEREARELANHIINRSAERIRAKFGVDEDEIMDTKEHAAVVKTICDTISTAMQLVGFTNIRFEEFK